MYSEQILTHDHPNGKAGERQLREARGPVGCERRVPESLCDPAGQRPSGEGLCVAVPSRFWSQPSSHPGSTL